MHVDGLRCFLCPLVKDLEVGGKFWQADGRGDSIVKP